MSNTAYQVGGQGTVQLVNGIIIAPRSPVDTSAGVQGDVIRPDGSPFVVGDRWQNSETGAIYLFLGSGNWEIEESLAGVVVQLTGDSGTATPTLGSIAIIGTANEIETAASASQVQIGLPASIIVTTLTATTIHGTTIDTNVAAAQLSLNATTISVAGTDANINMNLATKGTGDIIYSRSEAAGDLNIQITNSDNTSGTSLAGLQIATGGASSGDPYLRFEISGVGASTMSMGLDNSVSDIFVISNSNALGTSNALTLTQAGALTATTSISATTTLTAGTGITSTTGDIVATAGAVNAGTTMTAGTGITATTGNIVATAGAVNAGTSMTATLGAITATNGNLVLGTAGNKINSTSVGSGTSAGANSFGTVTLTGGTATVSTTAVTASSIIFLTRMSVGATGANDLGILSVGTIVASTSFDINAWTVTDATALQGDDVSVVGYMIVN